MLSDYKEMYQSFADEKIPGWKDYNKNQLCNLYLENEQNTELAEAYFAAIVCKYWNMIGKFLTISYNVADEETVYEWLVDSILYALRHKSWKNPKSSIYNDPAGPDKVINRCMKCRRFTYYQAINRKKRKGGFGSLSLEMLNEQTNSCNDILHDTSVDLENYDFELGELIRGYYDEKSYEMAYMLDIIAYGDVFIRKKDEASTLNEKKLVRELFNIDEDFIKEFAEKYGIESETAIRNWKQYLYGKPKSAIKNMVYWNLHTIKSNQFFRGV